MTKVFLSASVLKYRKEMAEAVSQTIKESFIQGVKTYRGEESPLAHPDLLPPPKIEIIELSCYQGKPGDLILLATSEDFGIWNVHIVIRDEAGNVVESGDAAPFEDAPDCWDYMTTTSVPAGTHVTVSAAATDQLLNVGVANVVGMIVRE